MIEILGLHRPISVQNLRKLLLIVPVKINGDVVLLIPNEVDNLSICTVGTDEDFTQWGYVELGSERVEWCDECMKQARSVDLI